MSALLKKTGASCGTGCDVCRAGDDPKPSSGGLVGWRLVVSAVAVFLVPLASALGGAVLAGGAEPAKLLGALCGLIVGLAIGVAVSRLVSRAGGPA